MTEETNGVRYTTREMFEKIDLKLDTIDTKLVSKVDVGGPEHIRLVNDVARTNARLDALEMREARLEGIRTAVLTRNQKIAALVGTLAIIAGEIVPRFH